MITLNHHKQQLGFRLLFFLLLAGAFINLWSVAVYGAEAGEEILKLLQKYEIDSQTSIMADGIRLCGYALIKGIGAMVDGLYSGISEIYGLLSFGTSSQLLSLVDRYEVLYKSLFIIAIVFFGIYLLCGKGGGQLNTVNCIIIIGMVIVSMPLFTQTMTKLTINATNYVQGQWVDSGNKQVKSIASSILADNIVDLVKVDNNISETTVKGLKKNKGFSDLTVGTDKWRYIDINRPLDPDKEDLTGDFWEKKLEEKDGKTELEEFNGLFDFVDTYYYRYQVVSWLNIFGLLLAVVIVLFFACVKCARIIIEVAMGMVYMPFIAVTDIAAGQRIKEAVKHFITLFFVLFLCIAILGVYFAGFTFINGAKVGSFTKLLMHIALAWAIIDGPSILERILGIDTGMRSGWQVIMGARAAGGMAAAGSKMAGHTAATAAGVGTKAASMAARMAVGKEGMKKAAAMKDAAKKKAGDAGQKVTGGMGMAGAVKHAAGAAKGKVTAKGAASMELGQQKGKQDQTGITANLQMDQAAKSDNANTAAQEMAKDAAQMAGTQDSTKRNTSDINGQQPAATQGSQVKGSHMAAGVATAAMASKTMQNKTAGKGSRAAVKASSMPQLSKGIKPATGSMANKTVRPGKPGVQAVSQTKRSAVASGMPQLSKGAKPTAGSSQNKTVKQGKSGVQAVSQTKRSAVAAMQTKADQVPVLDGKQMERGSEAGTSAGAGGIASAIRRQAQRSAGAAGSIPAYEPQSRPQTPSRSPELSKNTKKEPAAKNISTKTGGSAKSISRPTSSRPKGVNKGSKVEPSTGSAKAITKGGGKGAPTLDGKPMKKERK